MPKKPTAAEKLAAEIRDGTVDFADPVLAAAVDVYRAAALQMRAAALLVDAVAQEKASSR